MKRARKVHPAWIAAAITWMTLVASAGYRSAPSVLIVPLEDAFGWSRSQISLAISVNILLYGLKASSKESAKLAVVGESIQVEPYAIMFRKDDPQFQALVNKVITNSMKSGEFEKAYKKWFQTNIPPKNVNLNAPMSKELKDNLKNLSDKPAL